MSVNAELFLSKPFIRMTQRPVSLNNLSDEALFALVSKGDEDAFSLLVDRYLPKTISVASRFLGNSADADDVAQDVMMRIWTRGSLWRPGMAKFSTWLHRVTLNLCIDRLRKKQFSPLEDALQVRDYQNNPDTDLQNSSLKQAVQQAVDQLPRNQKAALILCHYEGFTGKETAKILGVSVLAIHSLLVRARTNLRITLANFHEALGGDYE